MPRVRRSVALLAPVLIAAAALVAISGSADAYPPGTSAQCALNAGTAAPGQSVHLDLANYDPHSSVSISFHSVPVILATVTTDATGSASADVNIPADAAAGGHVLVATEATNTSTCPIQVANAGAGGTGAGGSGGGGGGLSNTGIAVIGLVSLGLILVAGGAFMLVAGRRRRATV
jgi:hypothetical protein